jgi:hypothetical protein
MAAFTSTFFASSAQVGSGSSISELSTTLEMVKCLRDAEPIIPLSYCKDGDLVESRVSGYIPFDSSVVNQLFGRFLSSSLCCGNVSSHFGLFCPVLLESAFKLLELKPFSRRYRL